MSVQSVLVAGATGTQGGAVTDRLLDRGVTVHALTRDADSDAARDLEERGASVVEGDMRDADTLTALIEDVDAVYCVTTFFGAGGIEGEIEQGTTMVEVAADVGVDLFVFSSVSGPRTDTGVPHFGSKFEVERRIESLELPAAIIRPAFFMQNFEDMRGAILDGTLALPIEEGSSLQMAAPDDIGALAAAAFADPDRYTGEVIELASDENTLEGIAAVFGDVTGVDIETRSIPIDVVHEESGEDMVRMVEWSNQHRHVADLEKFQRDYDLDLTPLDTYLRGHGWEQ